MLQCLDDRNHPSHLPAPREVKLDGVVPQFSARGPGRRRVKLPQMPNPLPLRRSQRKISTFYKTAPDSTTTHSTGDPQPLRVDTYRSILGYQVAIRSGEKTSNADALPKTSSLSGVTPASSSRVRSSTPSPHGSTSRASTHSYSLNIECKHQLQSGVGPAQLVVLAIHEVRWSRDFIFVWPLAKTEMTPNLDCATPD